jgi:hypothetical protein
VIIGIHTTKDTLALVTYKDDAAGSIKTFSLPRWTLYDLWNQLFEYAASRMQQQKCKIERVVLHGTGADPFMWQLSGMLTAVAAEFGAEFVHVTWVDEYVLADAKAMLPRHWRKKSVVGALGGVLVSMDGERAAVSAV